MNQRSTIIMPRAPTTQRICLTAIEATKNFCIILPTLEGLKLALTKFHREVLLRYPYSSAAVLLLWSLYPKSPFNAMYYFVYIIPRAMVLGTLNCIGFEEGGVRPDSYGSRYQSRTYGGLTPRDSIFSRFQSYGATEYRGPSAEDNADSGIGFVGFLCRILGLSCMYAALVILLKHSG